MTSVSKNTTHTIFSFDVHTQGHSSARVVNQLLTEMDGMQSRKQVFVMAATNRPGLLYAYLNCNYKRITVIIIIMYSLLPRHIG